MGGPSSPHQETAAVASSRSVVSGEDARIRVFFRLRPMNNLEKSRRSKDCVELHDDPKILTVDAPLQGDYDFTCDMVFDEGASQDEVYHEAVSSVPRRVVEGIDCAVIAYGQTGTGKTHTMIGEGLGVEINARTQERRMQLPSPDDAGAEATVVSMDGHDDPLDPRQSEGMIPRAVADIFRELRREPESAEFVVRCSFVEIYLEKIVDLLNPSNEGITLHANEDGSVDLQGPTEVCCIEALDVHCLLARGGARRTQSSTSQNADSSRSHAMVTVRVDRTDRVTGKQRTSKLQMLDLAGSELARTGSSRNIESAVAAEGKMINQSLACLSNMIRATLAQQNDDRTTVQPNKFANASKLVKLLQPSFGGRTFTTLICTASPSSYNIGETINTIRFAQRVQKIRNSPQICEGLSVEACRQKLNAAEQMASGLNNLVRVLAVECNKLKGGSETVDEGDSNDDGSNSNSNRQKKNKLWSIIDQIVDVSAENDSNDPDGLDFLFAKKETLTLSENGDGNGDGYGDHNNTTSRRENIEQEIQAANQAKERAESASRDLISEVASLRSRNEILSKEKHRLENDLDGTKIEIRSLSSRMVELEHNLRTSQFRENEATTFLRQFRSFYLRLLKHKAAKGNSDSNSIYAEEVSRKMPGVPELEDLIDIDTLMMASGLVEEHEVGEDANNPNYAPSKEALRRSSVEAEQTTQREVELMAAMGNSDKNSSNGDGSASRSGAVSDPSAPLSIVRRSESAQLTSYRQKLLQSPAGLLAMKKEKELEKELLDLSSKCINLQNAVNAEKAMVEAMSSRQGALSKIKTAQEMNMLRQELERKTNDLQAIVLKMNELHLVNKTFDEKVDNRERHVSYLEEHLSDLQSRNRRLVIERQEAEKRLRDENAHLKRLLDGYSVRIWQLDGNAELAAGQEAQQQRQYNDVINKKLHVLIPFNGAPNPDLHQSESEERRFSIEHAIEAINVPAYPEFATMSTQTNESNLHKPAIETIDSFMQTEPPPECLNAEMQTDELDHIDTAIQTDHVETANFSFQTEAVLQVDLAIQTEEVVFGDFSMQTDPLPSNDISCQTNAIEATDTNAQTDPPPETYDSCMQTDEIEEAPGPEMMEIAMQTDGMAQLHDTSTQTEDIEEPGESEKEEKVEPPPLAVKKVAVDISTQTEIEPKADQGMQTDANLDDTTTKPTTADSSAHSDGDDKSQTPRDVETTSIATQTDFNVKETPQPKPCSDIAIQTDDLPHVIDVAGSRSVDTGSLADSEHNTRATAAAGKTTQYVGGSNLDGSMSSIGDKWKHTRHSSMSQKSKSEDESEDSLATSNIQQMRNKFAGKVVGNAANADTASNYAKFNSSASSLFKSPPVASHGIPKDANPLTTRPAVVRPPFSQGTPNAKRRLAKETPAAVAAPVAAATAAGAPESSAAVPEWMSKRKGMGLRTVDKVGGGGGSSAIPRRRGSLEHNSSGHMVSALSPKKSPKLVVGKQSVAGSNNQAEWMQRLKLMGKHLDDDDSTSTASSELETKAPVSPLPDAKLSDRRKDETKMEWMERFKQIGMKGEEDVIEASGTIPTAPPTKEEVEADDGQPEWKKKYKQIGQKGVEEVVTVDGVDEDDEEEMERIRKEQKKARKRERKAMKKAKKAQERQPSGY